MILHCTGAGELEACPRHTYGALEYLPPESMAARSTQAMRGCPANALMFFNFMPLLPPRARIKQAKCPDLRFESPESDIVMVFVFRDPNRKGFKIKAPKSPMSMDGQ